MWIGEILGPSLGREPVANTWKQHGFWKGQVGNSVLGIREASWLHGSRSAHESYQVQVLNCLHLLKHLVLVQLASLLSVYDPAFVWASSQRREGVTRNLCLCGAGNWHGSRTLILETGKERIYHCKVRIGLGGFPEVWGREGYFVEEDQQVGGCVDAVLGVEEKTEELKMSKIQRGSVM